MTPVNQNEPPAVFVYMGNPVPDYARINMRLSARRHRGKTILLTEHPVRVSGVETIDTSGWYDERPFSKFVDQTPLDTVFRGGFWLRAAERFFVLTQFMNQHSIARLLHLESDVLALDLSGLAAQLDHHGRGVFAPMEAPRRALASLLYVNDHNALEQLCDYTVENADIGNEMHILGSFMTDHPQIGHALPSDQVFSAEWPYTGSTVPSSVGLIDAASFGMWLVGWNPENNVGSTWNHRKQGLTHHPIEELQFRYSSIKRTLTVTDSRGVTFPLRNLHIHSKVFRRLAIPGSLWLICTLANSSRSHIVVWEPRSVATALLSTALKPRALHILSLLPGNRFQRLVGRVLAAIASMAPRPLTVRQRKHLNTLLRPPSRSLRENPIDIVFQTNRSSAQWPLENHHTIEGDLRKGDRIVVFIDNPPEAKVTVAASQVVHISVPSLLVDLGKPVEEVELEHNQELALALYFLRPDARPSLVVRGPDVSPAIWGLVSSFRSNDFLLGEEKLERESRHAEEFWGPRQIDASLSSYQPAQIIDPVMVRRMFPNRESVLKWWDLGQTPGFRQVNFFQSYVSWLRGNHSSRTTLVGITSRYE